MSDLNSFVLRSLASFAVILMMIVGVLPAQAAERLVDAGFINDHINVSAYLDFLPQDTARYTIEDIIEDQHSHQLPWQQNTSDNPGFGFDTHPYWFRLTLNNGSQQVLERLLEIKNPVLDEVQFYQVDGEGDVVTAATIGDERPTRDRPFFHHNLILPVKIPAAQTHYLYFRVTTSGALELPIDMWTPRAFQERDQLYLLFFGALFGILLVMGVYNFFIYTLFRDWSLLYYAGYAIGLMLFLASMHGFANQYFWPDDAWWRAHALLVIIPVTLYCAMMFTVSFLQLRNAYPMMAGLVRLGTMLCVICLVMVPFVPYSILIRILAACVFPVCSAAIVMGVMRWLHGYQPARYFIVAWTVFLLAISYYSLAKFGVFETSAVSEYAVQWGAVSEMVLFAFALADRLNSQRRSFVKAQSKALELQRLANEQLEMRVQERTQKLQEAMDDLATANTRLQALTMQDGLTGIYNRRYFDQKLEKEWQRALRNQDSLALLLIDIDFFKDFNDKYGHLAGDECLKRVAQVIRDTITRPSDAVSRYGGEEFVVVLPDTSSEGAVHVAENIRRAMQSVQIRLEQGQTMVSVSIGVAALIPSDARVPQDLISIADQALYQAKTNGRNRTQLAELPA